MQACDIGYDVEWPATAPGARGHARSSLGSPCRCWWLVHLHHTTAAAGWHAGPMQAAVPQPLPNCCPSPGYIADPLNSFAFFRADGAGAFGSRTNVTLQVGGGWAAVSDAHPPGKAHHAWQRIKLSLQLPCPNEFPALPPPAPSTGLHDRVPAGQGVRELHLQRSSDAVLPQA